MKVNLEILSRLLRDVPNEVTVLLNALYSLYTDNLINKALELIDKAPGPDGKKKNEYVAKELVKLGLGKSGSNLLIELLVALMKFIEANQNNGQNEILKKLSEDLKSSTAELNQAIQNQEKK